MSRPNTVDIPVEDYQRLCEERNEARIALHKAIAHAGTRSNLTADDIPDEKEVAADQNNRCISKIITACQRGLGEHE